MQICYSKRMKSIAAKFAQLLSTFRRMSFLKKAITITIVFFVILMVGIVIFTIFKKPDYKTGKVTKSDIVETVTEIGTLTVNGKVDIYSPTNGIIETIAVSNGDTVDEGQELFRTKSTATEQEKQAAYSNYLTAKSSLEAAQASLYSLQSEMFGVWDTYKNLAENDKYENENGTPKNDQRTLPEFHIAQDNWYAAEAKYKNQQTVISQAQAQTSSSWLAYQATQNITVTSPISGTVSNVSVIPGSNVSVNSPLAPATPVLTIGNFTKTEALILLGEDDIVKVKVAQDVEVSVDAVANKTYKGIVRRIDTIGTEVKGVIRYKVYVEILDPDSNLRPGMSIDVNIATHTVKNVLTVPNSSIKPYKGGKAVRVPGRKKGDVEYVPVQVGIRGEKNAQILNGLSEGQTIITTLAGEDAKKTGLFGF
jgi:HlyD family secretion protein